jgi:hypothetical protein
MSQVEQHKDMSNTCKHINLFNFNLIYVEIFKRCLVRTSTIDKLSSFSFHQFRRFNSNVSMIVKLKSMQVHHIIVFEIIIIITK